MDANDGDDLTDDEADVMAHRARAREMLDQITRQVKLALAEITEISLFFLIPNSGRSVIVFGTAADPSDSVWSEVSAIVSAIVRQAVGLDRVRCRPVTCATTDSIADQPSQPTGQSGCCSTSSPTPALQYTGAEAR